MNKLVPFGKFVKIPTKLSFLSSTSVVVDKKGAPLGFVFGRDSFITFLQHIDSEFEKTAKRKELAFHNPAGKLIDLIEDRLPVNPRFVEDLKQSLHNAEKSGWISFEDIKKSLNV